MSDIVIKKENHSNRLDKEEEKELLKEGFDVLVLEGQEDSTMNWGSYGFLTVFFSLAASLLFWILEPIYQNDGSLYEIAIFQGMDVEFTREGDHEIVQNAPLWIRITALGLFYTFFLGSMYYGLHSSGFFSRVISASFWLLGAIAAPLLLMRVYNHKFADSNNRDRIMAETIEQASKGGRVFAIVGNAHKPEKFLPSDLEYEIKESKSTEKTIKSGINYLSRITKSYFILLSLFLVTREVMKYIIQFV